MKIICELNKWMLGMQKTTGKNGTCTLHLPTCVDRNEDILSTQQNTKYSEYTTLLELEFV